MVELGFKHRRPDSKIHGPLLVHIVKEQRGETSLKIIVRDAGTTAWGFAVGGEIRLNTKWGWAVRADLSG